MPIVRADLGVFASQFVNDTGANGGRLTSNPLAAAVVGNVFPAAAEAERTAGSQKFRKVFFKNSEATSPEGLVMQNSVLFMENYSPGDDDVVFWQGTQIDTQSAYTPLDANNKPINLPGGRVYAGGQLNADTLGGATVVTVAHHIPAAGAFTVYVPGDTIRISDRPDVDTTGNNEVFNTIAPGGVAGPVGGVYTLTLVNPLGPAFAAANTRVSPVLNIGAVGGQFTNLVVTSGAGTFTSASNLLLDNRGTVNDGWTITFTSPTAFDVVGTLSGAVGSGTIGANFAPTNPDFAAPYFTLNAAGWGGTFAAADTLTFDTTPAATPIWFFRTIPPGANSITSNKSIPVFEGESP